MLSVELREANITTIYVGRCKSINIELPNTVSPSSRVQVTKDTYKAKAISIYKLHQWPSRKNRITEGSWCYYFALQN